jgi:hypothetical protein
MFTNALPSELIDVVAAVDPDAYTAAAVSSGYADMSDYEALLAIELAGDLVSTATLDLKLQSAVAATGGADIDGKAITQLTQAGTDSNKQALINLRREELTEGHRYVKAVRTLTDAGADEAVLILGFKGSLVAYNLPSEVVGLVACVDPDAYAPGTVTGDVIDMSEFHAALGILMVGDLGTAGTVVMKWEQAVTSGGQYKDVAGATTATIDQADSPNPSNQQIKLDLRAEDLDMANGYRFARLSVTVADATSPESATSDVAAVAFGVWPRTGLASAYDLASVDEIVA